MPANRNPNEVHIAAEHCAPLRKGYNRSYVTLHGSPLLTSLEREGLFPLSPSICERLDKFADGYEPQVGKEAERLRYHMMRQIKDLKEYDPERAEWKCSYAPLETFASFHTGAAYALSRCLKPDDFTINQRLSILEHFARCAVKQIDDEYAYNLHGYHSSDGRYFLASANCTLEEWLSGKQADVEKRIEEFMIVQNTIRNIEGYDWSPFGYIFGEELPVLAKTVTAMLRAELKLSYDTFKAEYSNLLDVVTKASQLGTMRSNSHHMESKLLDKYIVSIYLRDCGKGAKIAANINYHFLEPTKEAASLLALPFQLIFGRKK